MSQRNRWWICVFVFFATVLNYMDRQTLAVAAPVLQQEFHLDNARLGLVLSAFYMSYAISVALIGELIDRIPIRIAFGVVVTWWSLATGLTAFARTVWQLIAFRLMLGAGEAGNWPATARLVSMYVPSRERTLSNALYMAGGSLGLVVVQPLLVCLSLSYGWRAGFVIISLCSVIWILDLGYVASGLAVLALAKRGVDVLFARRAILTAAAALMAISMVLTPLVAGNRMLLLLFAGTFGMAGWNANYLCFVEELSEHEVAAVAGVIGSAGAVAGAISLWVIGLISQAFFSFTPVFILVALLILLATAGILMTAEPSHAPTPADCAAIPAGSS